jgi:hypothetical protein
MDRSREIIQGLIARGLPPHIAAGFAGNFAVESRMNPGINEIAPLVPGSRGGFGLAQWTGPRRRQFEAYAQQRGARLDDADAQLDFLMHELGTTERKAADAIMRAQTPDEAARLVSERFLRPGIPHLERRIAEARKFAGMPVDGSPRAPASAQGNALTAIQPGREDPRMNAMATMMRQQQDTRVDPRTFQNALAEVRPTLTIDQFLR